MDFGFPRDHHRSIYMHSYNWTVPRSTAYNISFKENEPSENQYPCNFKNIGVFYLHRTRKTALRLLSKMMIKIFNLRRRWKFQLLYVSLKSNNCFYSYHVCPKIYQVLKETGNLFCFILHRQDNMLKNSS